MDKQKFKVGDKVKVLYTALDTNLIGKTVSVRKAEDGRVWLEGDSRSLELIEPAKPRYTGELKEGMRVMVWEIELDREVPHTVKHNYRGSRLALVDDTNTDNFWSEIKRRENGEWWSRDLAYISHVISEPEEQKATLKNIAGIPVVEREDCPPGVMYLVGADFARPATFINSPDKGAKRPMKTLKKVTNLIRGLGQPLKNYVRLGWVIIEDDDYEVTEAGQEALNRVLFGIADADTLEKYAEKEVLRLKKEAKDKEDEE